MYPAIRNYRPLPTEHGQVETVARSNSSPGISQHHNHHQNQEHHHNSFVSSFHHEVIPEVEHPHVRPLSHHLNNAFIAGGHRIGGGSPSSRPNSPARARSSSPASASASASAARGGVDKRQNNNNNNDSNNNSGTRHRKSPLRRTSSSLTKQQQQQQQQRRQKQDDRKNSKSDFRYELEIEKLLSIPQRKPLPAPQGAPSFVIVASSSLAVGGGGENKTTTTAEGEDRFAGVPVTLAASFDRARAAASNFWRVPQFENPNSPSSQQQQRFMSPEEKMRYEEFQRRAQEEEASKRRNSPIVFTEKEAADEAKKTLKGIKKKAVSRIDSGPKKVKAKV